MFPGVDLRKIYQSREGALLMNQNHIEEAIVDDRPRSEVHSTASKSSIGNHHADKRVGNGRFVIDHHCDDLLPIARGCRNSGESEAKEAAHPLVMSLKALDNNGGDPLLTFIEEQLLLRVAILAHVRHHSHIHQPIVSTARCINLFVDFGRQSKTPYNVLCRPAADNAEAARGADHHAVAGEAVHNLMHCSITTHHEYQLGSLFDRRPGGVFCIKGPRRDEDGVIAPYAPGDPVEDLWLSPASFSAR